ncbi:MAG: hypothetical protein NT076_05380 [Candidatus Pacearchaeota archaeon]|nr:hypothetical protein [Candidatus Pacearchaeota archaeon]
MKRGVIILLLILLASCLVLAANFKDFDQGTFSNTYYNGSSILLKGTNTTGNFTSRIFDASTISLWNNISFISSTPSSEEFYAVDAKANVYFSQNSGVSWSLKNSSYTGSTPGGTQDIFSDSSSLYIIKSIQKEIYSSSNFGYSWTLVNSTFSNKDLFAGTAFGNSIYAFAGATGILVYKSSDKGISWNSATSYNGATAKGAATNSSGAIFVVDSSRAVYSSIDSATTWTQVNSSYGGATDTQDMFSDKLNNLYILTQSNKEIWKSINSGKSWSIVNNSFAGAHGILSGTGDSNGNIYAITGLSTGAVYKSTNYGVSWSQVNGSYNSGNGASRGMISIIQNSSLSFQVRNCSQSDCSDGIWQTPNLSNINLLSRYLQYRVNLTRDSTSLNPSLNNVTLDYTIQNAAPSISIINPSNSNYNSIQSILSYHVSDINNNLQTCKYSLNPSSSNTTIICGQNVSEISSLQGNNIWQVWVNDTYGLQASSQVSFFVDSINPQIEITSPLNNADTINNQLPIIYTASDTNLQACKYSINGASNTSTTCNQPISSTWNQGSNTIIIYTNDSLGNINYSQVSFFVDSISPSITITSPQSGATYGTNTSLELNYSASDTNLQACWWNIDNQANSSINCGQNTTFSTSSETHTITLFANDSLGNSASNQVSFEINIGAPTIILNSPVNAYLSNSLINFTFTTTDIDLDSCELWGNWTGWHLNQSKTISSGIPNFFLLNLTEGNYQWNIKCNDNSSHSSMNGNKSFSVDYTVPQVALTKPESSYSSKSSIPITFTISDTTNTKCYYNLSYQSSGAIIKPNTEIINCSSTSFDVDLDSSYIFWFFANDSAGNTIYINKNFTVSSSSGTSNPSTSSGGGGSSSSSSGTIKYFDITGDSSIIANAGEKKKLELKIKNSVSNFMNDCRIKSDSSWIVSSSTSSDLSAGQSGEFILDLNIPRETLPGLYNLSLAISCEESTQNFTISLEIMEKKLGLVLVEAKNLENSLEINYTLKELSGKQQKVELQIILFKGTEKIAEVKETQTLEINEERNFKTSLALNESLSGTFNLVINANSDLASAFLQEEVIVSNSRIGGLAVYLRENTANSLAIIFIVAVFGVFAFFILRRIWHTRRLTRN